ncbi:Sugar transporter [Emericellopsis cladophorae]|uniref:Sugar transporter n=1 Tax=Emericellopsis cladophorae TaxID=2686198 RepID=A0A9P9XUF1_9HYPO|nr:Sugar transporter [Emericellopsis cladophorae]KAI6777773.1 Sugar transporter [Emericellopsis cladophorae]
MKFLETLKGRGPSHANHAREEAPKFEYVKWTSDPGLRTLYWYCFILLVSSASTGFDGMMFGAVQNFDSWKEFFDSPSDARLGLLGACYQIGSVCSIPFVPIVADRWGRKPALAFGFFTMTAAAIIQGASQNWATFLGGRVLLGFGNSFAQMPSPMLISELAHPQHRARLTTIYNCLWNVGAVVAGWTCFGTDYWPSNWSWRLPSIFQGTPSFFQLIALWWIPESPRFLIAKDRYDEALNILAKYHANGNVDHPTIQFEYNEIRDTIKLEQTANESTSYLDFFRTKGNRYRLAIIVSMGFFSQWSGNAIVSNYSAILYENVGVASSTARLGISAGQFTLGAIVSISFALLVDRFGRRPIWLISTGGMLACLVFWTICYGIYEQYDQKQATTGVIFFIWLHGFFYSIAWSGLLIGYAIEILPYSMRAKGMMLINMCINGSLALNNQANPIAFAFWEGETWKLYTIYCCWVLFELVFIYYFYVETKGPTLEEIAKVFDGPDAKVAAIDLGKIKDDDQPQDIQDEKHVDQNATTEVSKV